MPIPLTPLAWLLAYTMGVVLAFYSPMIGLMTYLLDYYLHPPLQWWGTDVPDFRWSLIISLVLLVACLLHGIVPWASTTLEHAQTKWLLAWFFIAVIMTPFAVDVEFSLHYLTILAKLVLLYLLIVGTIRTPQHARWFIVAMIIGSLIWGWDAWMNDHKREGGRLYGIGGPDTSSDNHAASHLVTALPLLGVYLWIGNKWERGLCIVAAPFVLNTLILLNSRGSTLGILGGALAAIILAKKTFRNKLIGLLVLGGAMAVFLADPTFIERQLGIADYQDDGSASSRLTAWKGGLSLMFDYPLGAGGGGFETLSPKYIPSIVEKHGGATRGAHNTYIWVGSDWGFWGLFCFFGFIFCTLAQLYRIQKQTSNEQLYFESYGVMIALISFFVTAIFTNRPYAEILYWLAGLTAALFSIHRKELESVMSEGEESHLAQFDPQISPSGIPVSYDTDGNNG